MKIGITGATGFLGSYLVEYLKDKKYPVLSMTRKAQKLNEGVEYFVGDLISKADCRDFVNKVDVIIHLAHSSTPMTSDKDIASDLTLSLTPSLNLLEAIKESGKKCHLIYASSGGTVYGKGKDKIPFKETDFCSPICSYGVQKYTIENYIKIYAEQGFLTSTILRISNPYGVLLPSNRKQGLIGVVLNRLLNKEKVQIFGDPANIRDYVHLDDMSRAFELSLNKRGFNIFNIGSGEGYSVSEVLEIIEKHTNIVMEKEFAEMDEAKRLCDWVVLDISSAKKELNWEPRIKLEEGLGKLCEQIN